MCAFAERRIYDQEYRADLRAGAEDLKYEPPQLPEFNRPVQDLPGRRRRMTDREAQGLAAMRRLQAKPFPKAAGEAF